MRMTTRNDSNLISTGLSTSQETGEGDSSALASDARFETSGIISAQKRPLWETPRLERLGNVNDTTLQTFGGTAGQGAGVQ